MPTAPPPSTSAAMETHVFWLRYRKEIIVVLVLALLAALAYAGFRVYIERHNAAAAEALASSKSIADYERVIAQFPNTPATADAYLLLANVQRQEKKFADANATLQTFVSKYPQSELVPTARLAIAGNLDAMGKTDESLAMYQQIATAYPKSYAAPLALISRVHLLKAKNRNDDARQVCEAIMTQYRDSYWSREAMQQFMSLKPSAPTTPAVRKSEQIPPALLARPPQTAPPSGGKKPR